MFDENSPLSHEEFESGIDRNDWRLKATYEMKNLDPRILEHRDDYHEFLYIFALKQWGYIPNTDNAFETEDPHRTYVVNSNGFRGAEEFNSQVDFIATGCSQTFGLGVPQEATWGATLADKLNMSHATIALSGWSVQEMVDSIMFHIHKHGKPKVIAALLPDFGRTIMLEKSDAFVSEAPEPIWGEVGIHVKGFHYHGDSELPRISKRPHCNHDVLPPEFYTHIAAQSWAHFIEYCRVADIQLIWTSWDTSVLEQYSLASAISKIKDVRFEEAIIDLSGFFKTKFHIYDKQHLDLLDKLNCHSELENMWPECFREGTDIFKHYGTHAHAHIAEEFYDKYLLDKKNA